MGGGRDLVRWWCMRQVRWGLEVGEVEGRWKRFG